MGQIALGVHSLLPLFVSHRSSRSSTFLRVIRLIDFVTQLTAVLQAGSLVSCHKFLASIYVSIADLHQEYRCLCSKV
jgi:hypothetical protein